ncbi:MAG: 30S ribosomal protein S17 [Candidatus Yanofskybacteria bacterium RIFCSPLOWO2_01_FULL_49_17]|uniref:Small ribosomal subunit protein uS17 n=1 Tax=Candidatus Yanofskybacteria bacterium RIFCSPLOWO2_01_FULL_49_17 TaxID=1802700 RepID=A0A1F8GTR0_9BACT|nr:MAG: 30S ribosomal protein S17 [Candidatus Yanofskybacteria bacterium RIFCSPLOWO2_01_FULL_49_17]
MTTNQSQPRKLQGLVTSDKMTKTVVVSVTRMKKHPKYKKFFKVTAKFKAHNPDNAYHTGDKVIIQETRPMSKEKRWLVISKL